MDIKQLKAKITKVLNTNNIPKSKSSPSRVKGFRNYSHGYGYGKIENKQFLYWTWGNFDIYRNKSIEETEKQINRIFELLIDAGLGEYLELTNEYKNEKTILLKL